MTKTQKQNLRKNAGVALYITHRAERFSALLVEQARAFLAKQAGRIDLNTVVHVAPGGAS